LQAKVELLSIEEMIAIDAKFLTGSKRDAPFDLQQFVGSAPFEFSVKWIIFNKDRQRQANVMDDQGV
jgi:hypothetical protein